MFHMNRASVVRGAAKKIGCTPEEYLEKRDAGLRWCGWHREWHEKAAFHDSTASRCKEAMKKRNRNTK